MRDTRNPAAANCAARSTDFACSEINGRSTTARSIAQALPGSIRNGNGYLCRCPVPSHGKGRGDRNPSLSIADGDNRLLIKCFARCDPLDVIAELRRNGLIGDQAKPRRPGRSLQQSKEPEGESDPRALELWRSTIPAQGTLADKYLRARGITIAIPLSIRFLPHVDYMPRVSLPAMVAAVQAPDRKIIAAQITFLDPRGERKAQVAMPRKTIGKLGHGAVRLGPSGDTLGLAEGVETTLSAMQIFGVPAWATLGAGRAQNVTVPECVRNLRVFADNDATGRDAANKLLYLNRLTRRVTVILPPCNVKDWNDALAVETATTQ